MTKKKVDFSVRPNAFADALPATPEEWVREGKGGPIGPQKRLTLNLPAGIHTAFKSRCVVEGISIQDKVRLLIERELTVSQSPLPMGGETTPLTDASGSC